MIENVVECRAQIAFAALIGWNETAAQCDATVTQQALLTRLVLRLEQLHRLDLVISGNGSRLWSCVCKGAGRSRRRTSPFPTGKYARKTFDDVLVVGRDRLPSRVALDRAIEIELN